MKGTLVAKIEIKMVQEKTTKNKVVYSSVDGYIIDTLYVDKNDLRTEGDRGQFPQEITVTIEF